MATIPNAAGNEILAVRALPADLVEDLQRVQKAAQRITSILDLDQLIDSVVNEVTHSFGCLEASIYLHDEERGEMVLSGVRGCTPAWQRTSPENRPRGHGRLRRFDRPNALRARRPRRPVLHRLRGFDVVGGGDSAARGRYAWWACSRRRIPRSTGFPASN